MVASLTMLLDIPYEEAAQYFPPKAVMETGYRWEWLVPYLRANGIYLTHFEDTTYHLIDWSKPAMVDSVSLTNPEIGDHVIFWDGEKVVDPYNGHPRYTELPPKYHINNVYQLKAWIKRS